MSPSRAPRSGELSGSAVRRARIRGLAFEGLVAGYLRGQERPRPLVDTEARQIGKPAMEAEVERSDDNPPAAA